jgi:hypothetical protein
MSFCVYSLWLFRFRQAFPRLDLRHAIHGGARSAAISVQVEQTSYPL